MGFEPTTLIQGRRCRYSGSGQSSLKSKDRISQWSRAPTHYTIHHHWNCCTKGGKQCSLQRGQTVVRKGAKAPGAPGSYAGIIWIGCFGWFHSQTQNENELVRLKADLLEIKLTRVIFLNHMYMFCSTKKVILFCLRFSHTCSPWKRGRRGDSVFKGRKCKWEPRSPGESVVGVVCNPQTSGISKDGWPAAGESSRCVFGI